MVPKIRRTPDTNYDGVTSDAGSAGVGSLTRHLAQTAERIG